MAADTGTVVIRSAGDFLRFSAAVANLEPIQREAGRLMVAQAHRAFREQRLGTIAWPVRYPNQAEPFVNVAGAVEDLNAGTMPRPNRFARTPALLVTRRLFGSLAYEVRGDTVQVGSTVPYASLHQFGGKSSQTLTEDGKKQLSKFLKSKRGKPYRVRLGFLFSFPTLETTVNARPFLGMTTDLANDVLRLIARHFRARSVSGGAA